MSDQCGFILNNLCCCDDMECYGELCRYPDITECPVHLDPNYEVNKLDLETLSLECAQEELRIRYLQIGIYKKEVSKLRSLVETQNKLIQQLEQCLIECDPFLCNQLKEMLMHED